MEIRSGVEARVAKRDARPIRCAGGAIMGRKVSLDDLSYPDRPYGKQKVARVNFANRQYQCDGPFDSEKSWTHFRVLERLIHAMWPRVPTTQEYRAAITLHDAGVCFTSDTDVHNVVRPAKNARLTTSLVVGCSTALACSLLIFAGLVISDDSPNVTTPNHQYIESANPTDGDVLKRRWRGDEDQRNEIINETSQMTVEQRQAYAEKLFGPAH